MASTASPGAPGQIRLRVEGMMCQKNCGTTVRRALEAVPGVQSAEVSFAEQSAVVSGSASADALIDAVEAVGFDAAVSTGASDAPQSSAAKKPQMKHAPHSAAHKPRRQVGGRGAGAGAGAENRAAKAHTA